MVPRCCLNSYVHPRRWMLFTALVREAFLCHEQHWMQRPTRLLRCYTQVMLECSALEPCLTPVRGRDHCKVGMGTTWKLWNAGFRTRNAVMTSYSCACPQWTCPETGLSIISHEIRRSRSALPIPAEMLATDRLRGRGTHRLCQVPTEEPTRLLHSVVSNPWPRRWSWLNSEDLKSVGHEL